MRDTLLRLIIYAAAISLVAALLPGIHVQDNSIGTLLIVAIIFGLVNAVLKPALTVLSCPLVLLTLGLFLLVINGIMLQITDALAGSRFEVDGWGTAILGGLLIALVVGILEGAFGVDEKKKKKRKREDVMIIDG